jgi:ribosomal protein S18 acetylase RimI-like enzyme
MFRPITPADLSAVASLFRATANFNAAELHCLEVDLEKYATDPDPGDAIFVTEESGQITGMIHFGQLTISAGGWCIFWIGVHPAAQGTGTASGLLLAAETELSALGARLILIETSSGDRYAKARAFYRKHRYHLVAEIPHFYAPEDHKCTFTKLLTQP